MTWTSLALLLCCLLLTRAQEGWPAHEPPAHFRDDNFQGHATEHGAGGEHRHGEAQDHENFLGKERADQFQQLSPEESIKRLKDMIVFIDKNQDKIVDENELKFHLAQVHQMYVGQDVERNWGLYPAEITARKGGIEWDDYIKFVYVPLQERAPDSVLPAEFQKLQKRDKRRWSYADLGHDGILIKEEYACFMHPQNKEACPHMRDCIAIEAKEDIDKDADGYISLQEFVDFIYKPENHPELNGQEPEWVEHERKIFHYTRDKNRDGYLDLEEVKAWIVPEDFNRAEAEAKHLIGLADDNKDGKLQEEEMVNHYQVFVGSQVPRSPHGGEL